MFIISPYTYPIALPNNWYLYFFSFNFCEDSYLHYVTFALMWWKYQYQQLTKRVVSNLVKKQNFVCPKVRSLHCRKDENCMLTRKSCFPRRTDGHLE